jgi:TusA-related sulfurtransferase
MKGMNFMAYSYHDALKADIKEWIDENINLDEYEDNEDLYETINDALWVEDDVTGNGSGNYTKDNGNAWKWLQDDPDAMEYIRDIVSEFGIEAETVAEKFLDEDYEYWDVSIRCYLLGEAIGEALDELGIK